MPDERVTRLIGTVCRQGKLIDIPQLIGDDAGIVVVGPYIGRIALGGKMAVLVLRGPGIHTEFLGLCLNALTDILINVIEGLGMLEIIHQG